MKRIVFCFFVAFICFYYLAVVAYIGFLFFYPIYYNAYLHHIQTLTLPEQNKQFVLKTVMSGFDDKSWCVFELPIGADDKQRISSCLKNNDALLSNYSEAGYYHDNPKIEIRNDRYLVFSRGGLDQSLYDVQEKKLLINEQSIWHEALSDNKEGLSNQQKKKIMDDWVKSNLHFKIQAITNNASNTSLEMQ